MNFRNFRNLWNTYVYIHMYMPYIHTKYIYHIYYMWIYFECYEKLNFATSEIVELLTNTLGW